MSAAKIAANLRVTADMWLYVHGKQPSGRPGKLAISLVRLDKSAAGRPHT